MEIQTRSSRHRPRVDLTAMVDLGFLLITFFMLATTMSESRIMEVLKPTEGDPSPFPESKSLVLMLGTRDVIYSYTADNEAESGIRIDSFTYATNGLRARIMQRQQEVESMHGDKQQLYVIIKPLPGCSYKHMIDVLDEMMILQVNRYAITKAEDEVDWEVRRRIGEGD